ncbi:MAG: ribosome small subunit-dependent GTPase A [Clostridia bacterium]|nr:ribosome small subunit-dependent GTPase A [Clostridia bacterium]
MIGRIYKGTGGLYTVKTEKGYLELKARKNILKKGAELRAGDYVELSDSVIEELIPRKNTLIRPPVSNIDKLLIVIALRNPDPCFYNIDKMIAVAEYHGIEPVLILNKNDYEDTSGVSQVYGELPYRSYFISASERIGTDAVINEINGCTCVLSGVSGVGKSTLLNAIAPELLRETGDVSERLRRGKHTTRCAELFDVCGGTIADTPGFSSLELEAFDLKDRSKLAECFSEFREFFSECRFHDCAHVKDLGCAVREAVEEGKIKKSRYESYIQMYEELGEYKKWEDK